MLKFTNNKICCIFNQAAHYREPIYMLMDKELRCDFYITKWKVNPFKQMIYDDLKGFKRSYKNIHLIGNFYWQNGMLWRAFNNYKHYIITGEPYSITTWIMLIITKILGKKTYLWSHGWYGDETRIKAKFKKYFFSLSTNVLLYGNYARNLMIKEGFPSNKLICIYNSLDYNKQIKVRENLITTNIYQNYFHNCYPVLLYIGRIQQIKKIDLLIETLNIFKEKGLYCNLIIIGKESENTNIYEMISRYKLDKYVWFHEECYDEEKIGELIFNADVCVSPGNIGLSAMHSLVYGTPVITHSNFTNQMPEFEAITKGLTGDFFEEDSVEDLFNKINAWISLPIKQRELIRINCYKIIDEKYNPRVQIKIIANLLEHYK